MSINTRSTNTHLGFSFFILAFRATSSFWHSEPPSLFSLAFRVTISFFYLVFKVAYSFWRPEPLFASSSVFIAIIPLFRFGIQSRIFILAFKAVVQFSSVFKATPSVRCLELHFLFGIQSRCSFSIWCSELSFISSSAFRVVICFFSSIFRVVMSFFNSLFRVTSSS